MPRLWLLAETTHDIAWADESGAALAASAPTAFIVPETFGGTIQGAFGRYSSRSGRDRDPNAYLFVERGLTSHSVTPEAGLHFGVASMDGRRIAVEHDGASALYDVTSGTLTPIPRIDEDDGLWSPTGHALAIDEGAPSALLVVYADGTHQRYGAFGQVGTPFWDPSGEQVAFGRQALSIVGRDGTLETLELPANHVLFEVKWAATGDAFVYELLVPDTLAGDMCIAQRINRHFETIFCVNHPVDGFEISEDGQTVVYAPHNFEELRIFSLRTRSSFRIDTPLAQHLFLPYARVVGDTFLAWSGNGFVVVDGSGTILERLDRFREIHWVALDPAAERVALDDGADLLVFARSGHVDRHSLGGARQRSWTRDGRWIVLRHGGRVRALEVESGRVHTYPGESWAAFAMFD